MSKNGGIIGVSDHGGWAVLVKKEPGLEGIGKPSDGSPQCNRLIN